MQDQKNSEVLVQAADEPPPSNERKLEGWQKLLLAVLCIGYATFHLMVLNVFPIETWSFRIMHIAGALAIGYLLVAAWTTDGLDGNGTWIRPIEYPPLLIALGLGGYSFFCVVYAFVAADEMMPDPWIFGTSGWPLVLSTVVAIGAGWLFKPRDHRIGWYDWILAINSLSVAGYLLFNLAALQFRAGVMPIPSDMLFSIAGVLLILELTRRVAGMALLVIAGLFIVYTFAGPYLPGILNHDGYRMDRFFSYIYTDSGILGPTTAVSSTYIILFIAFGAFLQISKVGDYFVNFAFAIAGRARGGPAKVAVFASGLMGMINGTSAGNVVATGSLTIPLMKRVGYRPQSAGAIEAAASTGGQIMPPVMGAGALHHGGDHRHPLHRADRRRADPGLSVLHVRVLHGGLRGRQDGHARHAPGRTAGAVQADEAGLSLPAHHHPDRRALYGLFGHPGRYAGACQRTGGELAEPEQDGPDGRAAGTGSDDQDVDPADRRLRLRRHHRRRHRPDRRRPALLLAAAGHRRQESADCAVLRDGDLHRAGHGHADNGGLCGGCLGGGTRPHPARHSAAGGAFLRVLLRRHLGPSRRRWRWPPMPAAPLLAPTR